MMDAAELWVIGFIMIGISADVILVALKQRTESQVIAFWNEQYVGAGYTGGILAGHLFLNPRYVIADAWGYAFAPCLLLIGWDIIWHYIKSPQVWYRSGVISLFIGEVMGSLFWSQANAASILPW